MRITVLAGGIGGARFLLGVRAVASQFGGEVTAVVNVGDDATMFGLRICPDLDSVMYTLGDGIDPGRGWGRQDERWTARDEVTAYGVGPSWFGLGDRDLGTHLVRSHLLASGQPLSAVTATLCERWQPGVRLLPASDDPVETLVQLAEGRTVHFQEWWVRHRAQLAVERFVISGADRAVPAPGVLEAITDADVILLAPSNPVVSIAPILAVPGIRDALRAGPAPVIGVSPIIGGSPVRGMADRCLAAIAVPCTAEGVGRFYRSRRDPDGVLDGWLVDEVDAATDLPGVPVKAIPLWMTDQDATAAIVRAGLALV